MTTQTYLRQIEKLDAVIRNKEERVKYLRHTLLGHGIDYSKERVQTSPQDKFSAIISEYLDEEKEISNLLVTLVRRRNGIVGQLEQLDTKHYKVLYARYVKLKSFKQIMDEMDVSEQTVYLYHKNGLKEFEDKFKDDYINL